MRVGTLANLMALTRPLGVLVLALISCAFLWVFLQDAPNVHDRSSLFEPSVPPKSVKDPITRPARIFSLLQAHGQYLIAAVLAVFLVLFVIILNSLRQSSGASGPLVAEFESNDEFEAPQSDSLPGESFSTMDIVFFAVCMLIIILAISGTIVSRQYKKKLYDDRDPNKFWKDLGLSRERMTDDQRCTLEERSNFHKTFLRLDPSYPPRTIYCPPQFSCNSVWWALSQHDPVLKYYGIRFQTDSFVYTRFDESDFVNMTTEERMKPQTVPLGNIPGTNGIPTQPQEDDSLDHQHALELDYTAWLEYSKDSQSCKLFDSLPSEGKFKKVSIPRYDSGQLKNLRLVYLKCDTEYTPKVVFDALLKGNIFGNEKFVVVLLRRGTISAIRLQDLPEMEPFHKWLVIWQMYEPYKPINNVK